MAKQFGLPADVAVFFRFDVLSERDWIVWESLFSVAVATFLELLAFKDILRCVMATGAGQVGWREMY